jgi:uncharacterized protein YdhG (YjbR/CyaY superfamily)
MDCEPKWALTWALRNDANYYQEQTMTRRNKATTSGSPRDVDSYLAVVPAEARAALEKLRKRIKAVAPEATEVISYQIPTFKLHGRPLVAFAAFPNHCGFYVMSPSVMEAHKDELGSYDTAKGTIRFRADKPLPDALVRKLIKARIAENEGRKID